MTPREYIESVWASLIPDVALIDASNTEIETDTLASPWVGMLVQTESTRMITLGSRPFTEETGTVLLGVFTDAGIGPDAGTDLARKIVGNFLGWRSSDTLFEIRNVDGPFDLEPEADGSFHRLAVELAYGFWGQLLT